MELERNGEARKMVLKIRDSIKHFLKMLGLCVKGNRQRVENAVTVKTERNHCHGESAAKHIGSNYENEKTMKHRWYCVRTKKPQQNTFHR